MTDTPERIVPSCVEALENYQQADEDGIMVLASRQAIHETIDAYWARVGTCEELTAERDALAAEVERLRGALVPFVQHLRERPVSDTNAKFVLAPWHMGDGGWLAAMDFCKARAALEGRDG